MSWILSSWVFQFSLYDWKAKTNEFFSTATFLTKLFFSFFEIFRTWFSKFIVILLESEENGLVLLLFLVNKIFFYEANVNLHFIRNKFLPQNMEKKITKKVNKIAHCFTYVCSILSSRQEMTFFSILKIKFKENKGILKKILLRCSWSNNAIQSYNPRFFMLTMTWSFIF